jgi:hypothetical protein
MAADRRLEVIVAAAGVDADGEWCGCGRVLTLVSLDSMSNPRDGWLAAVDIGRRFGDASSLEVDARSSPFSGVRSGPTLRSVLVASHEKATQLFGAPEHLSSDVHAAGPVAEVLRQRFFASVWPHNSCRYRDMRHQSASAVM